MFFGMEDHTLDGLDTVLLTTAGNNIELGMIQGLLDENQIPYIIKDRGAGDYMRVLGGFSIFGTDIHVHKSDYETAMALVDAFVSGGKTDPPDDQPSDGE